MIRFQLTTMLLFSVTAFSRAAEYPEPVAGDYVIREFRFASGQLLPEVRIHYRTVGKPEKDERGVVRNAVLILHGTGGEGGSFVRRGSPAEAMFAAELFGKGQPLDANRFFIILPDSIGHGQSTKPSDGLRARFPRYGYHDMIEAQYRLVRDGLQVNHLRLVMGTSMGGMHTWLWGEKHPEFMDALMPLASLPAQISGRNRMWRKLIIDAIRTDPQWREGNYQAQPRGLKIAAEMMFLMSGNPVMRQKTAPTLTQADTVFAQGVADLVKRLDANDILYALESSRDYDPGPSLETIRARLLAVNSADDLINPPELGILEKEIKRVPKGKAIVIQPSDATIGHGTHTKAVLWKQYLQELLQNTH